MVAVTVRPLQERVWPLAMMCLVDMLAQSQSRGRRVILVDNAISAGRPRRTTKRLMA